MAGTDTLAPGLLVAAPPLADPNFDQSVVLLAAHSTDGAFGWVINGKEVMSFEELLRHTDADETDDPTTSRNVTEGSVRLGGPVGQEQVWLLFPTDLSEVKYPGQVDLDCGISATSSREILTALRVGTAPHTIFGVMGYAGWAPEQLESEIRVGAWLPTRAESSLVFGVERGQIWKGAYARVGANPIAFTSRHVGLA